MADHSTKGTQDQKVDSKDRSPAIRTVTLDDLKGTIGVCPETGTVMKVKEMERDDGSPKRFLAWISDCPVHIHTETRAKDDTEFIFVGAGGGEVHNACSLLGRTSKVQGSPS